MEDVICSSYTNTGFINGFIAGQVVLGVLIFFLLKVFLLRNSGDTRAELLKRRVKFQWPKARSVPIHQKQTIDALILSKLDYNPQTHHVETCEWINILFAQVFAAYRNDATFLNEIALKLDSQLNSEVTRPGFVGPITITEMNLGEEFIQFKNARVGFGNEDENMRIHVDFSFDDQLSFCIDTQALINWPKPAIASLPVNLSFTLVKFSGTVKLN